jgi:hypothetical protein
MKVIELIEQLNDIPEDRKDEEVRIYVSGALGGFLKIQSVNANRERLTIDTIPIEIERL